MEKGKSKSVEEERESDIAMESESKLEDGERARLEEERSEWEDLNRASARARFSRHLISSVALHVVSIYQRKAVSTLNVGINP